MKDLITKLEKLKAQLKTERSSFEAHWQDCSDYVSPKRYKLHVQDDNRGEADRDLIIDSTATSSLRVLSSGLMAGITSPARPWFRLSLKDEKAARSASVKRWLSEVEKKMQYQFIVSNLYNVLPNVYTDLGLFSTGAMLMQRDDEIGVRFQSLPIGSFWIGNDHKMRPRKFVREFRFTVSQVVEKFAKKDASGKVIDWSNISTSVKSQYETDSKESWVTITHVILPNPDHRPDSPLSIHKKFLDVYYENAREEGKQPLQKSGTSFFKVLCPRWGVTGSDVYGVDGPTMVALGDIKQLQHGEKKTAHALDKMVDPPMVGPPELRQSGSSIMAGEITYLSDPTGKAFRESHQVRYDITSMENKQAQVRQRIRSAYFHDLFLMISSSDRRNITATEIDARQEEKLLALGPVLEQLNQDMLDPLIENTFTIMFEDGAFPEPPEEIQGLDMRVEYISIMAQAQKLTGIAANDRLLDSLGRIANLDPAVLKKLRANNLADSYADLLGSDPNLLNSNEEVQEMEEMEAELAAQQQAEVAQAQEIQNMQQLSSVDTEGKNALTDLMRQSEAGEIVDA